MKNAQTGPKPEFTCDLEDTYDELLERGKMPDHDYLIMADKDPDDAITAAVDLANATGETVLLAYNGYGVTVLPGANVKRLAKIISKA